MKALWETDGVWFHIFSLVFIYFSHPHSSWFLSSSFSSTRYLLLLLLHLLRLLILFILLLHGPFYILFCRYITRESRYNLMERKWASLSRDERLRAIERSLFSVTGNLITKGFDVYAVRFGNKNSISLSTQASFISFFIVSNGLIVSFITPLLLLQSPVRYIYNPLSDTL